MDKLKIVVISNLYPPQVIGGYERAIANYANILKQRGHDVLVLTTNIENLPTQKKESYQKEDNSQDSVTVKRCLSLYGEYTSQGCHDFEYEKAYTIVKNNLVALEKELKIFKPDVCLAGNIDFLGVEVLNLLILFNIVTVHYVMNRIPGYGNIDTPNSPLYHCVTVSNWIAQYLLHTGYHFSSLQTIYPGVKVNDFCQVSLPKYEHLRIVYAGLLMHYKGADILLEALSILNTLGIPFTATLAGGSLEPEFLQSLKDFVEVERLSDQVTFTGLLSREELKKLYADNNIWVLPSRFQEPFSIGLVEAMMSGLTIVASNTGGSPEAISHCETGLIFESENALDLADMLAGLSLDQEIWEAIAKKGQQKAISNFSIENTVDQLEALWSKHF